MDETGHTRGGINPLRRDLFRALRERLAVLALARSHPDLDELGQILLQKRGCRR
jgi:hypothetical protein